MNAAHQPDTEELLDRAGTGDRTARQQLLARHRGRSASVAGPAGVVPLPSASGLWTADGGPTGSRVGPESTLVIQGMDPEDRRVRVIRIRSEATHSALALDLLDPAGEPSARSMADPRIGSEPRAIPTGTIGPTDPRPSRSGSARGG